MITIVGLGFGAPEALSLGAYKALTAAREIYFRTHRHPTVAWLKEQGITGESFDSYYEDNPDFESVYAQIVQELSRLAEAGREVFYAVPGDPWVAEATVRLLLAEGEKRGFAVSVIPSLSGLDAVFAALQIDPTDGLTILDALALPPNYPGQALLITQVYSRLVASQLKLWLLEFLPAETEITVVRAAGVPGEERVERLALEELDRLDWIDHLTSVYLPAQEQVRSIPACRYPLDSLVEVMQELRSEHGCPWDRQQTHESLKPYMLEECYEVWDAIDEGSPAKLCDELGDLLLQVIFHAQIAAENGDFDANDVVEAITAKLVRRHPHVFGDTKIGGVGDVLVNWEAIKKAEQLTGRRTSALDGIPKHLAGLAKAQKIQAKAAKVGFTWPDLSGAVAKLREEFGELQEALALPAGDDRRRRIEAELGDILFALANLARYTDTEAEVAINGAIKRFERRFRWIEQRLAERGEAMSELSLEELLAWWARAKTEN